MSTSLLERIVAPIGRILTPEAAREILEVRVDEETQRRIDELADKCNEGALTEEERIEYEEFVSMFNILTLLQVRARSILAGNTNY